MKVKKLIKELKKCDKNATVLMSKDPEGNDFFEVYEVEKDHFECDADGNNTICIWP